MNGSVAAGYAAVFNIAADSADVGATGSLGRPNAGATGGRGGPPPTA